MKPENAFQAENSFLQVKKCFSDAETHFCEPKIHKISYWKQFSYNGWKKFPNEKLSCFDGWEEINMFEVRKQFQLLKILIFSEKCFSGWKRIFTS